MIKSENLGQNAQNQRLFYIIAAPTKLVKYKIPVSKEPPYEHAAGLSPRNANKGQHGELSDAMRNFRNSMAEANACTKGEGVPYDTPPYEHAAGLFPALKFQKPSARVSLSGHLFIACMVSEQNPHIIAAGIENTININFAAVSAIKADIISAYNKAIIALYLRNRRQRSPCLWISLQNAETLCNSTYGC